MSREAFEKLFQVPEWASFDGDGYVNPGWYDLDPLTAYARSEVLSYLNAKWRGYQSRQPEIDELDARIAELERENRTLAEQLHTVSEGFKISRDREAKP